MTGVNVEEDDWQADGIENHFKMRFCILKESQCIETGRSLKDIQNTRSGEATKQFEQEVVVVHQQENEALTDWTCGVIEPFVMLKGTNIKAFPALVDYQEYVQLELLDTKQQADFYHIAGMSRLIYFKLKPVVKSVLKDISANSRLLLMYLSLGTKEELQDDIIMSCFAHHFLSVSLPNEKEEFDGLIASKKQDLVLICNERVDLLEKVLSQWRALLSRIDEEILAPDHLMDITEQLSFLMYEGFIRDVPFTNLQRYPKYLLAIEKRLDKLKVAGNQLQLKLEEIRHYWSLYLLKMDDEKISEPLKNQYRWSLEEYRIACFAQPMKPAQPISSTKLDRMLEQL
jgi:ATP-dependent helicase HrpA